MACGLPVSRREPLPPTINSLCTDPAQVATRFPRWRSRCWRHSRRVFGLPLGADNANAAFYRIYQFVITHNVILLRNELEYFCMRADWAVENLPDPADPDPTRYAALAAVTELLCDAFNRRVALGLPRDAPPIVEDWAELASRPKIYERRPAWAQRVPPAPNAVRVPDENGAYIEDDDLQVCEAFKRLNIIIHHPHIHFI
jgi:hypothetical protein